MKENAKKILLLGYTEMSSASAVLRLTHLGVFIPDLSDSGLRSLVSLMKSQGLLTIEKFSGNSYVRVTTHGRQIIETVFPALAVSATQTLATNTSSWSLLIFREAPKGDKQFRYLRSLLLKYRAVSLSRGIYIYPQAFPAVILTECYQRYTQSVVICQLKNWVIGDERSLAIEQFHLLDLIQAYSGISNEIKRLISKKKAFNDLNHQEKKSIHSLFDRFYASFQEDYGLLTHYFPQVLTGKNILSQLQTLLK